MRPIRRIAVFSRHEEHRQRFARELEKELAISVSGLPAERFEVAYPGMDLSDFLSAMKHGSKMAC